MYKVNSTLADGPDSVPNAGRKPMNSWLQLPDRINFQLDLSTEAYFTIASYGHVKDPLRSLDMDVLNILH